MQETLLSRSLLLCGVEKLSLVLGKYSLHDRLKVPARFQTPEEQIYSSFLFLFLQEMEMYQAHRTDMD